MKGISLSSVIQVINLEKQSCDIEARAGGQCGQLHFREGTLVDALADGLAGEDAAYEILGWDDPEFDVSTEHSPRDRTIEADLTQMLLEIARRRDEELEESARSAAAQDSAAPHAEPPAPPPLVESISGNGRGGAQAEPDIMAEMEAALAEVRVEPEIEAAPEPHGAPGRAPAPPTRGAPPAAAVRSGLSAAGLKRVVQLAKDGLGDALLSADLFSSADGTSYVGVNSRPAVCALVNQVTERLNRAFDKGGLPPLGRYYMAELDGSGLLLVAPCGDLQLVLVVDTGRVQLGLLINVVLPEVLAALEEVSPG